MNYKIHFERILYGNDGTQYRILRAADSGLGERVENLCKQVGTPDRSSVAPFLMSIPENDRLFVILGQAGPNDNQGRQTLRFHALVGNLSECNQNSVTAFTLWKQGAFASENNEVLEFTPLSDSMPDTNAPFRWSGSPQAIIAPQQPISWFKPLLGNMANCVAWSTFSFRALPAPFVLYGLSEFAPRPISCGCIDPLGNDLQPQTETVIPRSKEKPAVPQKFPWAWLFACLLVVSVVLNYILMNRKPEPIQAPPQTVTETSPAEEVPKEDVAREQKKEFDVTIKSLEAEIAKLKKQNESLESELGNMVTKEEAEQASDAAKEAVYAELKKAFGEENIIKDSELPPKAECDEQLKKFRVGYFQGPDKEFGSKISHYIQFVNKHILKQ